MEDSETPISDAQMVDQLVIHMARGQILTKARQKWERNLKETPDQNNWKDTKKWFRRELQDVTEAEEDTGMEKERLSKSNKKPARKPSNKRFATKSVKKCILH